MNGMYQNRGGMYSGLVGFVVVLALLGGFAAVGLAKVDFGSYLDARTEAKQAEANIAWEAELRHIDRPFIQAEREAESNVKLAQMEQEARIAEAQAQAELDRIEAEKAANFATIQEQQRVEMLRNNQQLASEAQWSNTYVFIARIFVTTVLAGGGIVITVFLSKRILTPQAAKATWKSADFRKREIAKAKNRERQGRTAEIEQRARRNGHLRQQPWPRTGRRPYYDLPEAG